MVTDGADEVFAATTVPMSRGRVHLHRTARYVTVLMYDVVRMTKTALAHDLGASFQSTVFSGGLDVVDKGGDVDVHFKIVRPSQREQLPMLELTVSLEALHIHWG